MHAHSTPTRGVAEPPPISCAGDVSRACYFGERPRGHVRAASCGATTDYGYQFRGTMCKSLAITGGVITGDHVLDPATPG